MQFKHLLYITSILLIFAAVATTSAGQSPQQSEIRSDIGTAFSITRSTPTITTKRDLYKEGEAVTVNGRGFRPYEQVRLQIITFDEALRQNLVLMLWNMYADGKGRFSTAVSFDSFRSAGERFTIKATGVSSKLESETTISNLAAVQLDFEHCANGPLNSPIPCNVSSGNDGYTRGNLGSSKAHYLEGQSVPVRLVATGLTATQSYTVQIGYDFTKQGKYAFDYLTTYNRTESVNNNPCVDVTGCSLGSASTFPIPLDVDVQEGFDQTSGTADDVTQINGNFTVFGGTITNVSSYTTTGSQAGDSSKQLIITFTANQANVVIAYSAHISTRADWGVNNSAVAITGSPYHNYVSTFSGGNNGNRDLQISEDTVVFPAKLVVVKNTGGIQTSTQFPFTVTGQISTNFVLDTDPNTNPPSDRYTSPNLLLFGNQNRVTVTEGTLSGGWQFRSVNCQDAGDGRGTSTFTSSGSSATVTFAEGSTVTCTYINDLLLAAGASISGSIKTESGKGVRDAIVTAANLSTGESVAVRSGASGSYYIADLEIGTTYLLNVKARGYSLKSGSKIISLNEDLAGADFTAAR